MLLSYTTSPRDILPSYTANPRRFTFLARTSHWRQNHSEMSVGYKIAVRSAWYNKQLLHTYGVTGRLFRNIAICRKKRRQSGEIGNVVFPVVCVYSRPRTRRGTKLSVVYYHIVARPDRKLFPPLIYSADCESVAAYFFFRHGRPTRRARNSLRKKPDARKRRGSACVSKFRIVSRPRHRSRSIHRQIHAYSSRRFLFRADHDHE